MLVVNFCNTSKLFEAVNHPNSHTLLQVHDYGSSFAAYTHVSSLLHYTGLHRSDAIFIPHYRLLLKLKTQNVDISGMFLILT